MTPTRWRPLAAVTVVVALLGFAVLRVWNGSGRELPEVPWTAVAGIAVIGAAVVAFAWPVRRWTRGARDRALDPLRAARTVVLAKAAQYSGAALTGWYVGLVLVLAPDADVDARMSLLLRAAAAALLAVGLLVVGRLVEAWCRVPHGDDQP